MMIGIGEYELTRDPDWREQLIAEINDEPVGFIQIIDPALEDSHYGEMFLKICVQLIYGLAKRIISEKATEL